MWRRLVCDDKGVRGRLRTSDGFRTSWSKACDRASIKGLIFHDLRGMALVQVGCRRCDDAH